MNPRARSADDLERSQILEVEGLVTGGRLKLSVAFNRRLHRRDTVQRFLDAYRDELLDVLAHCTSGRSAIGRFGLPPGDFDFVLRQLSVTANEMEEITALSPLQEGMLYRALEGGSEAYFEQFAYRLRGALDVRCFAASWQELQRRIRCCGARSRR